MSNLAAGYFRRTISNEAYGIKWPERSVSLIPYQKADTGLMKLIEQKLITVKPINEYFTDFNIETSKATRLFTHIGSGIGDILALSALTEYLSEYEIQVHAPRNKHVLFEWFKTPVDVLDYFRPIANDYFTRQGFKNKMYNKWHRLVIENAAIEARELCWYDAHFRRIGMSAAPDGFNRPQLRIDRLTDQPSLLKGKSVLICHRASCQMRSSKLKDFYEPIRKVYPDHQLYVHEVDLTDTDKRFIEQVQDILILPKSNLHDYLVNLYDADMVVTTDTGAIHFREGVERPALGVFAAMTTGSRTSGYKFTRSFNVKSSCEHQPCFIHERVKGQICLNAKEGDRVAKCQTGKAFQMQLERQLMNYILINDLEEFKKAGKAIYCEMDSVKIVEINQTNRQL